MAHRAISGFHLLQGKLEEAFNAIPLGVQLTVAVDADLRHDSSWLGRPRVEGEEGGGCTHIHTIHTSCDMEACYIRVCFFFAPYRCWLRERECEAFARSSMLVVGSLLRWRKWFLVRDDYGPL